MIPNKTNNNKGQKRKYKKLSSIKFCVSIIKPVINDYNTKKEKSNRLIIFNYNKVFF